MDAQKSDMESNDDAMMYFLDEHSAIEYAKAIIRANGGVEE